MVSFPPCKINLGLHVLRKREDGYHELETCFYPIPWTDVLEIIPAKTFGFSTTGSSIPGASDDNLCIKAYRFLQRDFQLDPVHIHLHKIIPMGAGLGGGSSDGAYTLNMLNSIFSLNLAESNLMSYAMLLGSDCAFFIQANPMIGTGRGEILTNTTVSLSGKYLIILNPDVHVSTAGAYAGIHPAIPTQPVATIVSEPISRWRNALKNDFETTVFSKHPRLQELKDLLYGAGAVYASMSGSGSTIFGIFDEKPIFKEYSSDLTTWSGIIP